MPNPQQPELRRSSRGAVEDGAVKEALTGAGAPAASDAPGPVPEENRPGHHPERDQDKPVERFRRRAERVAGEARQRHHSLRQRSVEVGRWRFDAIEGGRQAGDLVLLLHGFPQTAAAWEKVMPALGDAGFHTLAPDQRGYSAGARPSGVRSYRLEELVGDVLGMADGLGARRFHLVGHDWGGVVAWALAGLHPDRVSSLTAVSTPHPTAYSTSLLRSPQLLRSGYMAFFGLPLVPELLLSLRGGTGLRSLLRRSGLDEATAGEYSRALADARALGAALNWYRALPFLGRVPDVEVPTLYVWGDRDPALGGVAARATAGHVSGPYRFEVLEGVGHWIPEMASDQLVPLLLDHLGAGRASAAAG
ncbi:MAG TPA: alpha/beta fold hydrolase [Acidimicrobiales bacterium]|nr:alpha/beta fold hydrolase [Acidimicrobiales bacterium]